jgi:cell division protein FtsB
VAGPVPSTSTASRRRVAQGPRNKTRVSRSVAHGSRPKTPRRAATSDRPPPKPKTAKGSAAKSRVGKAQARRTRRSRLVLFGAAALSALIVAAWFPAGALYHQRQELRATSTQLSSLRAEDRALVAEQHRLSNPSEIERLARQQYQLVAPGQQVYQVLPFNGSSSPTAPYRGDPGLAGPVAPTGQSELPAGTTSVGAAHTGGNDPGPEGLIHRIVHTLEFWR